MKSKNNYFELPHWEYLINTKIKLDIIFKFELFKYLVKLSKPLYCSSEID